MATPEDREDSLAQTESGVATLPLLVKGELKQPSWRADLAKSVKIPLNAYHLFLAVLLLGIYSSDIVAKVHSELG